MRAATALSGVYTSDRGFLGPMQDVPNRRHVLAHLAFAGLIDAQASTLARSGPPTLGRSDPGKERRATACTTARRWDVERVPHQSPPAREAGGRRDPGTNQSRWLALKSSSANIGALHLASLCRELETAARAGTLDGASRMLPAIEAEYEGVRATATSCAHARAGAQ